MAPQKKIYIPTNEVARMLGVSVKTARSMLKRQRVGRKIGGRWQTTIGQLVHAFPEAFQELRG